MQAGCNIPPQCSGANSLCSVIPAIKQYFRHCLFMFPCQANKNGSMTCIGDFGGQNKRRQILTPPARPSTISYRDSAHARDRTLIWQYGQQQHHKNQQQLDARLGLSCLKRLQSIHTATVCLSNSVRTTTNATPSSKIPAVLGS